MATPMRCDQCGRTTDVSPSAAGETVHCKHCGALLEAPDRQGPTVILGDASTRDAEGPEKLSPDEVRALWADTIRPDTKPDMTIKEPPTGSSRTSRLVVKPHAVTSGAADPEAPADYELLEVLGEGGMGVVYAAHQTSIGRTIAVKMIKPEAGQDALRRSGFLTEAAVTGELEHPNIIPIYELGANADGQLFYAMKKVKGVRWGNVIKEKSQAENLDILMRVADAVAFAHSKGVVHRDIKPGNVMLGDFGEVLLIDWGLAVSVTKDGKAETAEETARGGTPAYMAPEMAMGLIRKIGFYSDIYLLGAILYEIVTGAPPHEGQNTLACVIAAADNTIQPTDQKGELADIALQALDPVPHHRYPSVKGFQAAIREYQAHSESIMLSSQAATRLAQAEVSGKYDDYARAVLGYEEALALWQENDEAGRGATAGKLAYAACAFGKGDLDLADSLLVPGEATHEDLARQVALARRERDVRRRRLRVLSIASGGLAALVFVAVTIGFFWVRAEQRRTDVARKRAEHERENAILSERQARSEKTRAQGAEKRAEKARATAEAERQKAVAERDRATAAEAEARKQRDISERENYFNVIALAENRIDDGLTNQAEVLLWSTPKEFRNWEWGRLMNLCHTDVLTLRGHANELCSAAFSPDGNRFVTASIDRTAKIWDAWTGTELVVFREHRGAVLSAAFSPDGKQVLTASYDETAKIWDAQTGKEITTFKGHTGALHFAAFSTDGKRIVTASRDKTAKIWDAGTGKETTTLKGHSDYVLSAAFSADGKRVVTASGDQTAKIWDAETGRETITLNGHTSTVSVSSAAFSPDGKRIVTASFDHTAKIWDAETGTEITTLKGHSAYTVSAAFPPTASVS